ncbi:MAG: hypothetical protein R2701_08435 [Acidimicrobiales bacterium]
MEGREVMAEPSPDELSKDQLKLLRRIDRATVDNFEGDFDTFINEVLTEVSAMTNTSVEIVTHDDGGLLWGTLDTSEDATPVYSEPINLGLNGLTATLRGFRRTRFRRPVDGEFMKTLNTQLSLSLKTYVTKHRSWWLDSVASDFFELDLHPELCFRRLAERLPEVFPEARFLSMAGTDVVQVLFRHKHDDTLNIACTTGPEVGALVDIADSVVGLVFDHPDHNGRDFVLGNPSKPPLRMLYKDFASGDAIESELVIPLRRTGQTFGALNLESADPDSFNQYHATYLMGAAPRLSEMVDALRRQLESDAHARLGVASAQSKYWESVGRILRHDLRTPANAIRLSAEEVQDAAKDIIGLAGSSPSDADLSKMISYVSRSWLTAWIQAGKVASQETELQQFVDQFTDYLAFGRCDAREVMMMATKCAVEQHADSVGEAPVMIPPVDWASCDGTEVFASPLLKVFVFNVLDNSIYWVRQRINADSLLVSLDGSRSRPRTLRQLRRHPL